MIPIISEKDLKTIYKILIKQRIHEVKFLYELLKKVRIVKEKQMDKKTVRLNSVVEVWNSILNKIIKMHIVLPHEANIKENKISVFAPISIALIGLNENDVITLPMPVENRSLKILKVINGRSF